ncbi:MAG: DUF2165 domain-containing protein [Chromatiales bacterium]|jgi:predicted small integral membrane protein|nr:DUF2165 domain-containing protein [Chromatiales bacterium]MDH4029610.1 DUF2165 domain-containing protein [Chromatiales bacterium]
MIRFLKISLVGFVAFFCLMYAAQNLVNLQPAYGFVAAMVGMVDHVVYPSHVGPSVHSPALVWLMLGIIILLELTAGVLAAKGAVDLWRSRQASAEIFNEAKKFAVLGAGLAVVIWFGIFSAIGGAYFQMWQTELGTGALQGAFWYSMQNGLIMLVVLTPYR